MIDKLKTEVLATMWNQPRHRKSEEAQANLQNSIKQRGILTPLMVRPIPNGLDVTESAGKGKFAVVAGSSKDLMVLTGPLTEAKAKAAKDAKDKGK